MVTLGKTVERFLIQLLFLRELLMVLKWGQRVRPKAELGRGLHTKLAGGFLI